MLSCVEETRLTVDTVDVDDAEGPSAISGKSRAAFWGNSWCSGEVLVKPEYNDTVVSKAPKCSGTTESRDCQNQNQRYCYITGVKQWVKLFWCKLHLHGPFPKDKGGEEEGQGGREVNCVKYLRVTPCYPPLLQGLQLTECFPFHPQVVGLC